MSEFNCIITNMKVSLENFSKWQKLFKAKPMVPAYQKIIRRYGAESVEDYFKLIKDALENNTIDELVAKYEKLKTLEMSVDMEKEKKNLLAKIEASKSIVKDNIIIRMLTDADESNARRLYILFKETMEEDIEEAIEYTQDFILKNIMFGIFVGEVLAGFIIINYSKSFRIDGCPEKVPTFYLQELLIDPHFRGQKLSKFLIEYCIFKCPKDMKYISLMTMPTNAPLIKVAESCGFMKQDLPSGDPKHSLLMIRNMDRVERQLSSPKESLKKSPKEESVKKKTPKSPKEKEESLTKRTTRSQTKMNLRK